MSSVVLLQLSLSVRPSPATAYVFTTIDVPFPQAQAATVMGLNAEQVMIGAYLDAGSRDQGFLWVRGHFTTLLNVEPQGINASGALIGFYGARNGSRGFVFLDGTFTPLEGPPPAPFEPSTLLTEAEGINDAGVIVGDYRDGHGVFHSFRYDPTPTPRYKQIPRCLRQNSCQGKQPYSRCCSLRPRAFSPQILG